MKIIVRGKGTIEVEGIIWQHELPIPTTVFATKSGGTLEFPNWQIEKIEA